jgi:hypothetical protein
VKIIYSAGNRIGANTQLARFLDNIDKTKYEVKTAAYLKSSYSLPAIDWNLNAIHKNIPQNNIKLYSLDSIKYKTEIITQILNDVAEFNPDLIICDNEHIFSLIAKDMDVPLWYCSPMLLDEGVVWDSAKKISYSYFVDFENIYRLEVFPEADKYLIYSPFCDLKKHPELKSYRDDDWTEICKYNWVRPYYNKVNGSVFINETARLLELNKILKYIDLKEYYFTDGNTDNLADAIYSKKKIIVSPSLKNREAMLNSILLNKYKIGIDIGQVELMDRFCLDEIENAMSFNLKKIELKKSNAKQLHEIINEFEKSLGEIDIIE